MSDRKNKFSKELDDLILFGEKLLIDMNIECDEKGFEEFLDKEFADRPEEKEKYVLSIPDFRENYQEWYSKALSVIKSVLPDRLNDFISHYEYKKTRKDLDYQNYMIRDYLQRVVITRGSSVVVDTSGAIPEFSQQLNMLRAAKSALDSVLMDMKAIVQADLFDSEIEATRVLAKAGYLRAAGAICGVVIEKHLLHICATHGVVVKKKNPSISELSQSLREADITTIPQWRFIQHLADIRNICDHAKGRDPSKSEIEDLIDGTDKILKTVF